MFIIRTCVPGIIRIRVTRKKAKCKRRDFVPGFLFIHVCLIRSELTLYKCEDHGEKEVVFHALRDNEDLVLKGFQRLLDQREEGVTKRRNCLPNQVRS